MASSDDLMALGNGLRAEVPGLIAPALDQLRRDITASFTQLNDAALQEIKTQTSTMSTALAQQQAAMSSFIETAMNAKFASAEEGFLAEQKRVQGMTDGLEKDQATLKAAIESVSEGQLAAVPTMLAERRAKNDTMLQHVHGIFKQDMHDMHERFKQ